LTAEALDFALQQYDCTDPVLRQALLDSYLELTPFTDVAPALMALRAAGVKCGILSNGTPSMLEAALRAAAIASLIDPVLSVDDLRIYKPDPRVYAMAARHLGLTPSEIGFVSSNAWDAMGAQHFGFQVFRLRRQRAPEEYGLSDKSMELISLAELATKI
jgi:2-haloacid dehalogenase